MLIEYSWSNQKNWSWLNQVDNIIKLIKVKSHQSIQVEWLGMVKLNWFNQINQVKLIYNKFKLFRYMNISSSNWSEIFNWEEEVGQIYTDILQFTFVATCCLLLATWFFLEGVSKKNCAVLFCKYLGNQALDFLLKTEIHT